jgi:hypothetical protein
LARPNWSAGEGVGGVLRLIGAWLAQLWAAIKFVTRQIGRWLWAPFPFLWRLYRRQRRLVQVIIAVALAPWILGHLYFIWHAAWIRGLDLGYVETLRIADRAQAPGAVVAAGEDGVRSCGRSYIAAAASELIDFNVNRNLWISSNPFYKAGFLFLIDWDRTKLFDNKAAFQRGVHQAVQRTLTELADTLGRVRGTAAVDPDLSAARGNIQFDQYTWILNPFSTRPFGPTTTTPVYYRNARASLLRYQDRLVACSASFDVRADNLLQFLDRIAADIGSTTATLMERADSHHSGWFDTRADDLFMFAKGQMYAYHGILAAARADFREVVQFREISAIWDNMERHIEEAIRLSPLIISNGAEDGWIMPSHLTTLGFYILRARSNLVEIRSVLDR